MFVALAPVARSMVLVTTLLALPAEEGAGRSGEKGRVKFARRGYLDDNSIIITYSAATLNRNIELP